MSSKENMTLRVILAEADITLTSKPCSVEDLICCLRNTLGLDYILLYSFEIPSLIVILQSDCFVRAPSEANCENHSRD